MHGRVEGARDRCAVSGCGEPGEYKAPLEPANFNGPGSWRFLCLDHVREHNAKYNFFSGMSPEEIAEAQTSFGGWERSVRAFSATVGASPAWTDLDDPLDAIAARFRRQQESSSRFSTPERRALAVLGLGEDTSRHALRTRYSKLVRRYHPDKNGGDRTHETRLREVIEAYQSLRRSAVFA
ncbi:DnaJ domain-containing protein [Sphingomonas sp.]|uniref:J domain-containing protein n=1 Tax=Sphingomonas sp. TaxID=28214 RepID=UPI00286B3AF3|nr:DnaJ domain-containing protein [Sphingomonas sp.]